MEIQNFQTLTGIKLAIKNINSMVTVNKNVLAELEKFKALAPKDQFDLVVVLVKFQSKFIADTIREGNSIAVPSLGTFAINEGSVIYRNHLDKVANELDYIDYYHVPASKRTEVKKLAKVSQTSDQFAKRTRVKNSKANKDASKVILPFQFKKT